MQALECIGNRGPMRRRNQSRAGEGSVAHTTHRERAHGAHRAYTWRTCEMEHTSISEGLKSIESTVLSVEMAACAQSQQQTHRYESQRSHCEARGVRRVWKGHASGCGECTSIVWLRSQSGFFFSFFSSALFASTIFGPAEVACVQ